MPVSPYFSQAPLKKSDEHRLIEDQMNELVQINGFNCYYIIRDSESEIDWLLGEDPKSKFERVYEIEMLIPKPEGWSGGADFLAKFAHVVSKSINIIVTTRAFKKYVPEHIATRPREGDLIFVRNMNKLFEIKYVNTESSFYTLGKSDPYYYEMSVEQFIYSHENFETEYEEINEIEDTSSYIVVLPMVANSGTGHYRINEQVTSADASAIVSKWFPANTTLHVHTTVGEFVANTNVTGTTSNTTYRIEDLDNTLDAALNILSDNRDVKTRTNVIVDRTETNPFGDFN